MNWEYGGDNKKSRIDKSNINKYFKYSTSIFL